MYMSATNPFAKMSDKDLSLVYEMSLTERDRLVDLRASGSPLFSQRVLSELTQEIILYGDELRSRGLEA